MQCRGNKYGEAKPVIAGLLDPNVLHRPLVPLFSKLSGYTIHQLAANVQIVLMRRFHEYRWGW